MAAFTSRGGAVGVAVAAQSGSPPLLASVRDAFAAGMDLSLAVTGVVALIGAVLALILLPARPAHLQAGAVPEPAAESVV